MSRTVRFARTQALAIVAAASVLCAGDRPGAARAQQVSPGSPGSEPVVAAGSDASAATEAPEGGALAAAADVGGAEDAGVGGAEDAGGATEPVLGSDVTLHDPSGAALSAFHAALRRAALGEGQARIVVYGASHVAGDLATGTLRRLLQEEFGDAGHGFILPAHPWPHYRHLDITVQSNHRRWQSMRVRTGVTEPGRYGLAGVALTTDAAGAYGRVETGTRRASRFELFYWRQPDGGTIEVRIDDELRRRLPTRAAEPGPDYALFTASDAPHTFEIRTRGDGPVTVFGVAIEREVPGVVLDTLGINGARAAAQLLWDEALWREHLRRRAPDLVVLAYGTNESGDDDQPIEVYEAELRQVVQRVRAAVPGASCLLIGPSDRPVANRDGTFAERPRTALIIDVQRRVAAEHGCAFFDLVEFGGGPLHMVRWASLDPPWAQPDHVHFTIRGYTRLGEVLHRALLESYRGPRALAALSGPRSGSGAPVATDEAR